MELEITPEMLKQLLKGEIVSITENEIHEIGAREVEIETDVNLWMDLKKKGGAHTLILAPEEMYTDHDGEPRCAACGDKPISICFTCFL